FNAEYDIIERLPILNSTGYPEILMFLVIGILLTYILQSSSALIAITFILYLMGWLSLSLAAALVIGEHLGSACRTRSVASNGNVHAKRAAGFHLVFSSAATLWSIILLPLLIQAIVYFSAEITAAFDFSSKFSKVIHLPLFHLLFNVSNILLLAGFIPVIEQYLLKRFPVTGKSDEEFHLRYINSSLL